MSFCTLLGGLAAIQAVVEGRGVQAKLGGVALQAGYVQRRLISEQQVMVLPEFVLLVGAFGRLGCLLGIGMYGGQGKSRTANLTLFRRSP